MPLAASVNASRWGRELWTGLVVILVLYAIGVVAAFLLAEVRGCAVWALVAMAIGAALAFRTYSASSTAQYASASVLRIAFYAIALPLVAFGVGLSLGSLTSFLPRGLLGQGVRVGILVAPIVALLALDHLREVRRDALLAETLQQEAAFRPTSVKGIFAGVPVTLPASPDIEVHHDCWIEKLRVTRTCRTMFCSAVGLRGQEGLPSPAVFREIHIRSGYSDLAAWCNRRPELETCVWCTGRFDHEIRLSDEPSLGPSEEWTRIGSQGEGVQTFCMRSYQGYQCDVRFEVAPTAYARVWMINPDLGRVTELAVEMQGHAERIWDDISGQDVSSGAVSDL